MQKHRLLLVVGGVIVAAILVASLGGGDSVKPYDATNEWRAAVKVAWFYVDEQGYEHDCGGGSGTLVADTQTVLTAEHVITLRDQDRVDCPGAKLWVGYPVEAQGLSYAWWPAEVTAKDDVLDVALVRVNLSGEPDGASKAVGAIESIRDGSWGVRAIAAVADGPDLGDPLHVLSYPGIGGPSITYTAGHAAGWSQISDQDSKREFVYLKLDLTIAGGSSGGGVLDASGRLVGVVLAVGSGYESDLVDCRPLADTNGDGEITDADPCVPVGGFINAALSLNDVRTFLGNHGALAEEPTE